MKSSALLMVLVGCSLLVTLAMSSEIETDWNKCLPPPYLYITFEAGGKNDVNNVMRYSRDGCNLGPVIHSSDANKLNNPSGIALVPAIGNGDYLLVANGGQNNANVALFGSCNPNDNNYRPFISYLVTESSSNPGLSSPFDIHVYPPPADFTEFANSSLYVSNADSGVITYYSLATGLPRPTSSFLTSSGSYPPGSFAAIDSNVDGSSFRGFAFDSLGNLWAADDEAYVLEYDGTTGQPKADFPVVTPIYVDFFEARNEELIFVGSNADGQDAVYAYDPTTFELVIKYNQKLDHPNGFVAYDDILYVMSAKTTSIVTFNLTTGHNLDIVAKDLPDEPLSVILGYC
eukprot:TRINITY_DN3600_c0_g3_i1.p1 TRINITY_DN3600_c0_g3~~TRINITY_DN3600_c0_g3_i1.p1  ORF type:complete len:380 (-),score=107.23 TRINITY_DN3600_c0_g3_i1:51-1085(-)